MICPPITFDSRFVSVGQLPAFSQETTKVEPMFFNSDIGFAYLNGGPITRAFIDALPDAWRGTAVLDSRVHMLMPGWLPAIPGWHHDDVPRPLQEVGKHFGAAGQPDYVAPRYRAEHIMAIAGAPVSLTEFAIGAAPMPGVEDGEIVYGRWSPVVDALIDDGTLKRQRIRLGEIVQFDWQAFHRAVPADGTGWRWFCRVSRNTERTRNITNECRVQVQVYLPVADQGW